MKGRPFGQTDTSRSFNHRSGTGESFQFLIIDPATAVPNSLLRCNSRIPSPLCLAKSNIHYDSQPSSPPFSHPISLEQILTLSFPSYAPLAQSKKTEFKHQETPVAKDFAFQWGTSEGNILSVQINWTITIIRVVVVNSLLKMSSMYSISWKLIVQSLLPRIISNHYKLSAEDEAARLETMWERRDSTIAITPEELCYQAIWT